MSADRKPEQLSPGYKPGPYRLDEVFAEQAALAESLGFTPWTEQEARAGEAPVRARERTATHEAGHTIMCLFHRIEFESVCCFPAGPNHLSHGSSRPRDSAPLPLATVEDRVAVVVGGLAAESVGFRAVDPSGAWQDCRSALARASGDVALVREVVARVVCTLGLYREELEALADALLTKHELSSAAVRALLVERTGIAFPPAELAWYGPDDEQRRVRIARDEIRAYVQAHPL